MSPEQAQQNLANIISEYLAQMQREGRSASASLVKECADASLRVIESAIPKPEAKQE
jgi:F0F1-type ATP synthase membrane subunit b/b'